MPLDVLEEPSVWVARQAPGKGRIRGVRVGLYVTCACKAMPPMWRVQCSYGGSPSVLGFEGFLVDRFQFHNQNHVPLRQWLRELPSRDPKQRFKREHIEHAIMKLDKRIDEILSETYTGRRERIHDGIAKWYRDQGIDAPQKLLDDIDRLPASELSKDHMFAIMLHSVELYEDFGEPDPKVPCEHQLYQVLNTVCRGYGHCINHSPSLLEEWRLFVPFVHQLDRAIRALPRVPTVLYRGMSRSIEAHMY